MKARDRFRDKQEAPPARVTGDLLALFALGFLA